MPAPATFLALYVAWLALLFLWRGPPSARAAGLLFMANLLIAAAMWFFLIARSEAIYDSPLVDVLLFAQQAATISVPVTLSYWLFGRPVKLSFANGVARVVLATLAGVWAVYLEIVTGVSGQFLPSYYWREYLIMGIAVPTFSVLAGYFAFRRPQAERAKS